MPAYWTEDQQIGNALAGLADSFSGSKAVAMANALEDIKKKREQAAAAKAAIDANAAMWGARQPPTAAPVTPGTDAWATGGGAVGTEVVPPGGPAPLKALTPDITALDTRATGAAQQQINAEFDRVRRKQLADAALGYQHATSMGDVITNAPKGEAYTQLDLYGVPKTLDSQMKMQTQLTGQLPMLDVKGTTNNYSVQDSQGNVIGSGTTRDGRTDLTTGQPIQAPTGGRVLKMGDMPADQSPFKDTGAQLQALNALTAKVGIGQQALTPEERQRAGILLGSQFPNVQKVEKDDAGNFRVIGYNEKVVPPVYAPLIAHLNAGFGGAPPQAPAQPAPSALPSPMPTAPPAPGVTTGPMPAAPAAAPTAADTKPIVSPGAVSQTGVSVSAPIVQGSGDPQLKEVLNHPIVKGAMDSGRAYNELLAASQAKTPEADLHMIYMLAKIYDPNSVVREGEVATAANTSPAMEKWWGLYNKQMSAGSALSDRARTSFIEEGYKAATAHYNAAEPIIQMGAERAQRLGLDPRNVTPPLTAPQRPGQAPAQQQQQQPAAAGAQIGTERTIGNTRYRKTERGWETF